MKKWIISIVVVVVVLAVAGTVWAMTSRVSSQEAEQIALSTAGGGEIVKREISSEGPFSEYSYTVVNGDTWYEIDINGFGTIEEMNQGIGDSWKY